MVTTSQAGSRLRAWRECQGLSQEDLAQRLGTSQANVSGYEAGKRLPSLRRAAQIEDLTEGAVGACEWVEEKEPAS